MGERLDDVEELDDRPRPAVTDDERHRRRGAALLVNEVKVDAVNRHAEVGETIDRGFVLAPVILLDPVRAKLLHVVEVCAVLPATIVRHLVPRKRRDLGTDLSQGLVGDLDTKGNARVHA